MTTLRTLFMAIAAAIIVIEMFAADVFPTEWNLALAVVAVACIGGVGVIAHATRNEVKP